jgi:hypothetical protein
MNFDAFTSSLEGATAPEGLSPLLTALWLDRNGHWDAAHGVAQDVGTPEGSLIHAYLHRKEGDAANAAYWYARAAEPMPDVSLETEWEMLVRRFLRS